MIKVTFFISFVIFGLFSIASLTLADTVNKGIKIAHSTFSQDVHPTSPSKPGMKLSLRERARSEAKSVISPSERLLKNKLEEQLLRSMEGSKLEKELWPFLEPSIDRAESYILGVIGKKNTGSLPSLITPQKISFDGYQAGKRNQKNFDNILYLMNSLAAWNSGEQKEALYARTNEIVNMIEVLFNENLSGLPGLWVINSLKHLKKFALGRDLDRFMQEVQTMLVQIHTGSSTDQKNYPSQKSSYPSHTETNSANRTIKPLDLKSASVGNPKASRAQNTGDNQNSVVDMKDQDPILYLMNSLAAWNSGEQKEALYARTNEIVNMIEVLFNENLSGLPGLWVINSLKHLKKFALGRDLDRFMQEVQTMLVQIHTGSSTDQKNYPSQKSSYPSHTETNSANRTIKPLDLKSASVGNPKASRAQNTGDNQNSVVDMKDQDPILYLMNSLAAWNSGEQKEALYARTNEIVNMIEVLFNENLSGLPGLWVINSLKHLKKFALGRDLDRFMQEVQTMLVQIHTGSSTDQKNYPSQKSSYPSHTETNSANRTIKPLDLKSASVGNPKASRAQNTGDNQNSVVDMKDQDPILYLMNSLAAWNSNERDEIFYTKTNAIIRMIEMLFNQNFNKVFELDVLDMLEQLKKFARTGSNTDAFVKKAHTVLAQIKTRNPQYQKHYPAHKVSRPRNSKSNFTNIAIEPAGLKPASLGNPKASRAQNTGDNQNSVIDMKDQDPILSSLRYPQAPQGQDIEDNQKSVVDMKDQDPILYLMNSLAAWNSNERDEIFYTKTNAIIRMIEMLFNQNFNKVFELDVLDMLEQLKKFARTGSNTDAFVKKAHTVLAQIKTRNPQYQKHYPAHKVSRPRNSKSNFTNIAIEPAGLKPASLGNPKASRAQNTGDNQNSVVDMKDQDPILSSLRYPQAPQGQDIEDNQKSVVDMKDQDPILYLMNSLAAWNPDDPNEVLYAKTNAIVRMMEALFNQNLSELSSLSVLNMLKELKNFVLTRPNTDVFVEKLGTIFTQIKTINFKGSNPAFVPSSQASLAQNPSHSMPTNNESAKTEPVIPSAPPSVVPYPSAPRVSKDHPVKSRSKGPTSSLIESLRSWDANVENDANTQTVVNKIGQVFNRKFDHLNQNQKLDMLQDLKTLAIQPDTRRDDFIKRAYDRLNVPQNSMQKTRTESEEKPKELLRRSGDETPTQQHSFIQDQRNELQVLSEPTLIPSAPPSVVPYPSAPRVSKNHPVKSRSKGPTSSLIESLRSWDANVENDANTQTVVNKIGQVFNRKFDHLNQNQKLDMLQDLKTLAIQPDTRRDDFIKRAYDRLNVPQNSMQKTRTESEEKPKELLRRSGDETPTQQHSFIQDQRNELQVLSEPTLIPSAPPSVVPYPSAPRVSKNHPVKSRSKGPTSSLIESLRSWDANVENDANTQTVVNKIGQVFNRKFDHLNQNQKLDMLQDLKRLAIQPDTRRDDFIKRAYDRLNVPQNSMQKTRTESEEKPKELLRRSGDETPTQQHSFIQDQRNELQVLSEPTLIPSAPPSVVPYPSAPRVSKNHPVKSRSKGPTSSLIESLRSWDANVENDANTQTVVNKIGQVFNRKFDHLNQNQKLDMLQDLKTLAIQPDTRRDDFIKRAYDRLNVPQNSMQKIMSTPVIQQGDDLKNSISPASYSSDLPMVKA